MIRISVVIITFNEEKNIGRCLGSVQDIADEVMVVDSFSTDKTREICISFGVKFIENKWPGYIEQKNFGNKLAANDLILSLDADEALSEELRNSIIKVKEHPTHDVYSMNRLTNYCGKWIRHGGWYPDRQTRLFDRRKGCWEGEMIHEKFVPEPGSVIGHLNGDLLHYSYDSIEGHVRQANHFTDLTASAAYKRGKRSSFWKICTRPAFKFLRDYIIKLGFLDGYYGYMVCRISAFATFLKYSKLRELHRQHKTSKG